MVTFLVVVWTLGFVTRLILQSLGTLAQPREPISLYAAIGHWFLCCFWPVTIPVFWYYASRMPNTKADIK